MGEVRSGVGEGAGLPGADAVEAAELLACGRLVQAPTAPDEPAGDGGAVFYGLVVVVLELGPHLGHFQTQAADAGQHPAVRRPVDGHGSVVALGLEVGELAAQQRRGGLR
ncbi:hypothetical protein [Streptomyces naphthomycinicus]|uniref:hypothetical protein n=1 Tax=Streptomyces naphthomycinicus TaxID=2872625 RepID=UPI003B75BC5C